MYALNKNNLQNQIMTVYPAYINGTINDMHRFDCSGQFRHRNKYVTSSGRIPASSSFKTDLAPLCAVCSVSNRSRMYAWCIFLENTC